MKKIRVLVIDDSAFMRKMIADILESADHIQVVATARNGVDGLEKARKHAPDVITLDVEMPEMDGISTLTRIMKEMPTPVVMLSSLTKDGAAKTVQAISKGAVDFIAKPSGSISLDIAKIKEEIISKVIAAANVKLQTAKPKQNDLSRILPKQQNKQFSKSIVAIGTSTGGPRAIQRVLTELPKNIAAPVVIVQHMPAGFTRSLADRLNSLTQVRVKEATHGEILHNGTVYIAPGDYHMRIRQVGTTYAIELSQDALISGHRPSVDVLFESISTLTKLNKIAIVLTGMGSDGANSIKLMKEKDPNTVIIAESEESAVVYGMPKAAVKTNSVNYIVHLHQIGETICKLLPE
ncbi:protein-glutamate methylesterase/protein-glutamine glutaminase [Virgibacillus sp. MG-45]|uniref:protein-glutamate methylesterase/protein-glutamine glutaminase n=1 Tax=Virgibacillus sp. MG-45 TaxID=3102791 RepID=UPI002ED929EA